jgi:hypothetical protein
MVKMAEEKNKLNWESEGELAFNDEYKVPLTLEESLNNISFRVIDESLEISDKYGKEWIPALSAETVIEIIKDNDGAGSLIDADLLDGIQGSNYARLDISSTFTATPPFIVTSPFLINNLNADLIDGYHASISDAVSTAIVRDASKSINLSGLKFSTSTPPTSLSVGQLAWNNTYSTLDVKVDDNVTLQLGQELLVLVRNSENDPILNGQVVYAYGSAQGYILVKRALAAKVNTGTEENPIIVDLSKNVLGIATEDILAGAEGFISQKGLVGSLNNSIIPTTLNPGDKVFLSPIVYGGLTKERPVPPNSVIEIGYIVDIPTSPNFNNGKIFAAIHELPLAEDLTYNNQIIPEPANRLLATNVQSAIDELELRKADVSLLSSNIRLYPTNSNAYEDDELLPNYKVMVTDITDSRFDDEEEGIDLPTGDIPTNNGNAVQLPVTSPISLIADPGLFIGNPGVIAVTTIGNIKKLSGNANEYSEFFFKIFKRSLNNDGTTYSETELATSDTTGGVNPASPSNYFEFSASALLNVPDNFIDTDRIVIRYYAKVLSGATNKSSYAFQIGGISPIRTLFPVPVSVIPSDAAGDILVLTGNFNGILSGSDSNVQAALNTIDAHNHNNIYYTETELLVDGVLDTRYLTSDANFVKLTGDQSISGTKTISTTGGIKFAQNSTGTGFVLEIRTSDPLNPEPGRMWMVTDVNS